LNGLMWDIGLFSVHITHGVSVSYLLKGRIRIKAEFVGN